MSTIQAHEAAISTVTVEIKTLMVSNRQMTLAVFRQLERAWPWGEEWENVRLWGWVNYHFSDCCQRQDGAWVSQDPGSHMNIVFSADGGLYRGTVHCWREEWSRVVTLPQLFIAA